MHSPGRSSLDHFAPHVSQYVEGAIKVRATMKGFYGNTLRYPGDIFGIHKDEEFAPSWMERLSDDEARAADPAAGATEDALDDDDTPDVVRVKERVKERVARTKAANQAPAAGKSKGAERSENDVL